MGKTETFIVKAKKVHGDKYNYDEVDYINSKTKVTIYCNKHKSYFKQIPNNHLSGQDCPECGKEIKLAKLAKRRRTREDFLEQAHKVHGDRYTYDVQSKYVMKEDKVRIICPEHGEFYQLGSVHVRGHGCPECAVKLRAENKKFKPEATMNAFRTLHPTLEFQSTYTGMHEPLTAYCPEHDLEFTRKGQHFTERGCPQCGWADAAAARDYSLPINSSYEIEIQEFLTSIGVEFEANRWTVLPRIGNSSLEVDVWVPSKKVAIEFHGLYFHSQDADDPKRLHLDKWQRAQTVGIHMVQIFQDEWVLRRHAVENRLRSILGVGDRVYARKLTVAEITYDEAKEFLELNHTQGAGRRTNYCYALKDADGIKQVITMTRVDVAHNIWEISRLASVGTVVGGFGRLLKHVINSLAPERVISYCDLRYGTGVGYEALGFKRQYKTEPDWWWLPTKNTQVRLNRQETQRRNLYKYPALVEYIGGRTDISGDKAAIALGWRKVYGVGSYLYTLDCAQLTKRS